MKSKTLMLLALLLLQITSATTSVSAWTLKMKTKQLPDLLQRTQSKLGPLVKVSIAFSDAFDISVKTSPYEDLFYGAQTPIGCVQHAALAVTHGTTGAIYIDNQAPSITPDEIAVMSNALKRVYLDLYMLDCQVRDVVIPIGFYGQIVSGLQQQGFQQLPTANSQESLNTLILLHLVSSPPGQSVYLRL